MFKYEAKDAMILGNLVVAARPIFLSMERITRDIDEDTMLLLLKSAVSYTSVRKLEQDVCAFYSVLERISKK